LRALVPLIGIFWLGSSIARNLRYRELDSAGYSRIFETAVPSRFALMFSRLNALCVSFRSVLLFLATVFPLAFARAQEKPVAIHVDWSNTEPLRTTPTLQIVVNPLLLHGSPIHDAAFANLKGLGADYVRLAFWHPYPKLAVAELDPPSSTKTSRDFSLIDPLVADFHEATAGHSTIFSLSTMV
jgi:hypothetical protein